MRLSPSLLLLFLVLVVVVALTCGSDNNQSSCKTNSVNRGKGLSDLFNFETYKRQFNKHYGSLVEELARQKIVLARAFRALASMISYKLFRSHHFLSLNPTSDETPEERLKRRLSIEAMQGPEDSGLKGEQTMVSNENFRVSVEEIERELGGDLKGLKNDDIGDELKRIKQRSKREAQKGWSKRDRLSWEDLIEPAKVPESEDIKAKLAARRLPSNNPNYEQLELSSSAANNFEPSWPWAPKADKDKKPAAENQLMQMLSGGAKFLRNMVESSIQQQTKDKETKASIEAQLDLGDVVHVDLRRHRCFLQARGQGKCGSCYAFAAIALYEYLYCRQTGHMAAFSEQYMVDCGSRVGLSGCYEGHIHLATEFVENYGLELALNYPYRDGNDTCPYDGSMEIEATNMGYIRTRNHPGRRGWDLLEVKNIESYLKREQRPIVVGLKLTPDFHDYGGGVDMGEGCGAEGGHALLLVGHGREDGEEYYLLRNSYSVSWGELGYYKISKRALQVCRVNELGVVVTADFNGGSSSSSNSNSKGDPLASKRPHQPLIQQHYRRHMLHDFVPAEGVAALK